MRQAVLILIALATALCFTACGGGGSSSSTTTTNTVVVSPTTLSLNQTDVASLSAQVLDSTGAAVTNPKSVVYTSDTPAVATVNPTSGLVCGGTWDTSFVNCTPGQVGKATITANSGGLTATITVYVHKKVDRVVINTPSSACKSMGQTLQLSATAYSNGTDVTSTVGPLNWRALNSNVATVDTTGILTAVAPGGTTLYATISNVTSPPVSYTTCGVRSINLHVSGASGTAFSLAAAGTQQLTADVIDSAGNTISPTLT
ncbi:MAG: Ig-like domain-containing protein, partial [Terriglobales bacterium]